MPSHNVLTVDDSNFEAVVLGSSLPFLLDLTATWCGPCKALAPLVDRIADANVGGLRVGKLDLDDAPATAARLGVRAAPTLIVFRDGREVRRHVGLMSADKLAAFVRDATQAAAPVRT